MFRYFLLIPITFVYSNQYFHHNFHWYFANKHKDQDYQDYDSYDSSKNVKKDNFGEVSHTHSNVQPWDSDYGFWPPWQKQHSRKTTPQPKANYYPSNTQYYNTGHGSSEIDDPTKYPFGQRVRTTKKPNLAQSWPTRDSTQAPVGHPWHNHPPGHPWHRPDTWFGHGQASETDEDEHSRPPGGHPWHGPDSWFSPEHSSETDESEQSSDTDEDEHSRPPAGHPWHGPQSSTTTRTAGHGPDSGQDTQNFPLDHPDTTTSTSTPETTETVVKATDIVQKTTATIVSTESAPKTTESVTETAESDTETTTVSYLEVSTVGVTGSVPAVAYTSGVTGSTRGRVDLTTEPSKLTTVTTVDNRPPVYTSVPKLTTSDVPTEVVYVSEPKIEQITNSDAITNIVPIISTETGTKKGHPLFKVTPPVIFVDLTDEKTKIDLSDQGGSERPIVVVYHNFDNSDNSVENDKFIKSMLARVEESQEKLYFKDLPPNVQVINNKNEIDSVKSMFNIDDQNITWYYSTVLRENKPTERDDKVEDLLTFIKSGVLDELNMNLTQFESPDDLDSMKNYIKSTIIKKLDSLYRGDNSNMSKRTTREDKNLKTAKLGSDENVPEDVRKTIQNIFNIRDSLPIEDTKKDFSFIPDTSKRDESLIKQINSGTYDIHSLLPEGENPEMYPPEILEAIQKDIGGAINRGHVNYFTALLKEDKNADVSSVFPLRFKNVK